jgi:hypothetical protein
MQFAILGGFAINNCLSYIPEATDEIQPLIDAASTAKEGATRPLEVFFMELYSSRENALQLAANGLFCEAGNSFFRLAQKVLRASSAHPLEATAQDQVSRPLRPPVRFWLGFPSATPVLVTKY